MKVALLLKGPIRPDSSACLQNLNRIRNTFKEFELEEYAFVWKNEHSIEFAKESKVQNIFLIQEPSEEHIRSVFPYSTPCGCSSINAYKHFWIMRTASQYVLNNSCSEFVIYCRLDTEYDFLNFDIILKQDQYTMAQNYVDLVGIAPKQIMADAWDYKNIDTLNEIYKNSTEPESCWRKIMEMNNVNINTISGHDGSDSNIKPYSIKYTMNPHRR